MSSKKEELLGKPAEREEYELNDLEKSQVASLMTLITQARIAQDTLYTAIVEAIADRYELVDKDITLNMQEIENEGLDVARLIVVNNRAETEQPKRLYRLKHQNPVIAQPEVAVPRTGFCFALLLGYQIHQEVH